MNLILLLILVCGVFQFVGGEDRYGVMEAGRRRLGPQCSEERSNELESCGTLDSYLVGRLFSNELNVNAMSDTVIILEGTERKDLAAHLLSFLSNNFNIKVSSFKIGPSFAIQDFLSTVTQILRTSQKVVVFSHTSLEQLVDILLMVEDNHLENARVSWITLGNLENLSDNTTSMIMREYQVGFIQSKTKYSLSYSVPPFASLKKASPKTLFLTRKEDEEHVSVHSSEKSFKNIDLNGATLKVAVVDNWPFFGLNTVGDKLYPDSGIDFSVLKSLGQVMNFSFEIVSPDDGQWGGPQADGTISGMIGMVARGEADLAIDEITITGVRTSVVDFTSPYYLESSIILSKAPQPASRALAVFSPFSTEIWLILAVCTIAYGFVEWFIQRLFLRNTNKEPAYVPLASFIMCSLQSMTVQGTPLIVHWWPLRFLLISWYMFGLLMDALYSGTLTAVLAAPTFERPIETLEDLLTHGHTTPVVTVGSSIHELFETATSGIYRQLFLTFDEEKSLAGTVDEGVDKVLNEDFALIEARLASEIRASIRNKELFYISRQSFYPQAYGIACKRGSPLTSPFNALLGRLLEAGLINKWKEDQVRKVSRSSGSNQNGQQSNETGPKALGLNHLQGAFFLFFIGITLAISTGIWEVIFRRKI